MPRDSKTQLLANVSLFSGCSAKELDHIAGLVDEAEVAAGDTLITSGGMGREAFVVVSGEASVSLDGTVVGTAGPGTVLGEMSLLDATLRRSATVTATTAMRVLVIGPREFDALITAHPAVLRGIASELARRLHAADTRLLG
jgi:CRP/FNR family transcriptional regulator, cyclic AMP receptor protein